jgi:signal transduction histidine kinase
MGDSQVQDHGPGIAPEVQQQLTERFVRGHGSRGLGLGLYLVRGIAEAHRGTLTVEQALGRGTTFQIALPMQQVDTVH